MESTTQEYLEVLNDYLNALNALFQTFCATYSGVMPPDTENLYLYLRHGYINSSIWPSYGLYFKGFAGIGDTGPTTPDDWWGGNGGLYTGSIFRLSEDLLAETLIRPIARDYVTAMVCFERSRPYNFISRLHNEHLFGWVDHPTKAKISSDDLRRELDNMINSSRDMFDYYAPLHREEFPLQVITPNPNPISPRL